MTLAAELALDRIEGLLATELPAHVRAFATAYAQGRAAPPAPAVLTEPATFAAVTAGLGDPALAARARRLWRLCALVPIANAVGPVEAAGWDELRALAERRNAAARRVGGKDFLALAHDVYEVGAIELRETGAARVAAIGANAGAVTKDGVLALWGELTELPPPAIVVADARPRTFAVRPGEAIVVVRGDATVSAWSAVAHELGHAWVAIAGLELPRTLDEAVAITASRLLERREPAAARVHARQETLAHALAAIECDLYAQRTVNREPKPERERTRNSNSGSGSLFPIREDLSGPPWALWHDPGAQAAYVAAYARAWTVDRLDDLRSRLS